MQFIISGMFRGRSRTQPAYSQATVKTAAISSSTEQYQAIRPASPSRSMVWLIRVCKDRYSLVTFL